MTDNLPAFDPGLPVGIVGAGVMGTKVAWACARVGLATRLFDAQEGKAQASLDLALSWSQGEEQETIRANLIATVSLAEAMEGAQLGFENVPERVTLKQSVHKDMAGLLPSTAYIGTNASALMCTPMAEACGEPQRFFALNFSDPRTSRLVELMTAEAAAQETIAFAMAWARAIRMVPVRTRKEQLGYSFNRLWRVIKKETLRQIAQGHATPQDIDRAWMLIFGTPMGPCGLMDEVGLHSVLAIEKVYHQESADPSDLPPDFLIKMVEAGELGAASGSGFYTHPDPEYRKPGFLEEADES